MLGGRNWEGRAYSSTTSISLPLPRRTFAILHITDINPKLPIYDVFINYC